MNVEDSPFLGRIVATGADDRIFDTLVLLGPVLILLVAVLGRSTVTTVLAVAYIGAFAGYVILLGLTT